MLIGGASSCGAREVKRGTFDESTVRGGFDKLLPRGVGSWVGRSMRGLEGWVGGQAARLFLEGL